MSFDLCRVCENSGGFDNDIDAEFLPGEPGGILPLKYDYVPVVDLEQTLTHFDFSRKDSVG